MISVPINSTGILYRLFKKRLIKDVSTRVQPGVTGIVTRVTVSKSQGVSSVSILITEKRRIQLGDKIAGRHGNKGVVSKILPVEDMPYLPDGTPVDMLLNPLGIPSRMNVGQIYEALLTLAGLCLKERYKILPFDEMYQTLISKSIVYQKLNEARVKTKKDWIFNPANPGKMWVFNGKTGEAFEQPICIGYSYMLKLIHVAKDKLHARVTGPYSLVIKQPLRGKASNGGQRLGEMEVWAIEGFGAAYNLRELLTIKSDDVKNRTKLLSSIIEGSQIPKPNLPESFKTLVKELQALCIDIRIFSKKK